ncbi:MAG: energy transducer TonB, partial [Desulfobacterales bacterium]|nr:energy transducer TonB [Desulfobacterales bacterium]
QPDGSAFGSAGDYFDMLNLRINSAKTYPSAARERRIEGRVTVQFTLLADGSIREVKIVKSSRNRRLDKAAVQAVEKAAPYPRPPVRYLKPPATLKINLSFELI